MFDTSKVDDEIEQDIRRTQKEIESRCSERLLEMVSWVSVSDAMEHGCLVGGSIVRWIVEREGLEGVSEKDRKELLKKVLEVYRENKMVLAIMSSEDVVSTVVSRNED